MCGGINIHSLLSAVSVPIPISPLTNCIEPLYAIKKYEILYSVLMFFLVRCKKKKILTISGSEFPETGHNCWDAKSNSASV